MDTRTDYKMVHRLPPMKHQAPLLSRLFKGQGRFSFQFDESGIKVWGDNCGKGKAQLSWSEIAKVEKRRSGNHRLLFLLDAQGNEINCITLNLSQESKRRINLELERLAPQQHPLKAFFMSQ